MAFFLQATNFQNALLLFYPIKLPSIRKYCPEKNEIYKNKSISRVLQTPATVHVQISSCSRSRNQCHKSVKLVPSRACMSYLVSCWCKFSRTAVKKSVSRFLDKILERVGHCYHLFFSSAYKVQATIFEWSASLWEQLNLLQSMIQLRLV